MQMSLAARSTISVLAVVVVLLFATGAYADSVFTMTFTGSDVSSGAYSGFSVSGTLDGTVTPDGLGDCGYLVTSLTDGSLTFSYGSVPYATYAETGLVSPGAPGSSLDSRSVAGSNPIYDYPTEAGNTCGGCNDYDAYDDILFPGASPSLDYWGLLFNTNGFDEPVDLFCSSSPIVSLPAGCYLSVWLDGTRNGNDPYDSGYEYLPVTIQETAVPEPSSLSLLGAGLGFLMLAGFGRRAWLARSADLA